MCLRHGQARARLRSLPATHWLIRYEAAALRWREDEATLMIHMVAAMLPHTLAGYEPAMALRQPCYETHIRRRCCEAVARHVIYADYARGARSGEGGVWCAGVVIYRVYVLVTLTFRLPTGCHLPLTTADTNTTPDMVEARHVTATLPRYATEGLKATKQVDIATHKKAAYADSAGITPHYMP